MPIHQDLLKRLKDNDPMLVELDLSEQKPTLTDADIQELAIALKSNTHLKRLNVSKNQIGSEGAKFLSQNQTLASLDVSDNQIGSEGAKFLSQNQTLTSLDVSYNRIRVEGAKFLSQNQTLTSLNVRGNQIGSEGAKFLSQNQTLTSLNVRGNHIRPEGAKFLSQNQTLTSLDVRYNLIGAEGAKFLSKNQTLTSLDVGNNEIGSEGAQAFLQNQTLTQLSMTYNNIPRNLLQQLEKTMKANKETVKQHQTHFLNLLILLVRDNIQSNSVSFWRNLPIDIQREVIWHLDYPYSHMQKTKLQRQSCADFLFQSAQKLNKIMQENKFCKIIETETSIDKIPHFKFFNVITKQNLVDADKAHRIEQHDVTSHLL